MVVTNKRSASLYGRIEKLLVSFEWSDCIFSVSGKDFKAHKLILGVSSPVFEAMLYGPLSNNETIVITDMESEIFQILLNYVYTDKLEISSIEQAYELLYASRKYLLEHLTELCIIYIQSNLSIDNVISVLNYPEFIQDEKLTSYALNLLCKHAHYLLKENKSMISCHCMKAVLKMNEINIQEKDLIINVFSWTSFLCEQNDLLPTLENRRNILVQNGMFQLLRFYALSVEDLNAIATNENNLLLPVEISHILKLLKQLNSNILEESTSIFCATTTPRISLKIEWSICHRTALKPVAPIVICSSNYIIHSRIKASQTLFINSLVIPSRMSPVRNFLHDLGNMYSEQFSVTLVCESDNSTIKFTNFMNTVEYDSAVDIELSEPCPIQKDKWYKITFNWPRDLVQTSCYFTECRAKSFYDNRVSIEFDDNMSLSTQSGGSFLVGLRYCL